MLSWNKALYLECCSRTFIDWVFIIFFLLICFFCIRFQCFHFTLCLMCVCHISLKYCYCCCWCSGVIWKWSWLRRYTAALCLQSIWITTHQWNTTRHAVSSCSRVLPPPPPPLTCRLDRRKMSGIMCRRIVFRRSCVCWRQPYEAPGGTVGQFHLIHGVGRFGTCSGVKE